jgi:uncharacterized protein YeeX (DUF496 family)
MSQLQIRVKDIEENIKQIKGLVYTNPLALLLLDNEDEINYVNNLLPYSTGFEIECSKGSYYNENNFRTIPLILDVQNGSSEQRYRIPAGINGFLCLYFICVQLKINSSLNLDSGIHYHIDCHDIPNFQKFGEEIDKEFSEEIKLNILAELENWNYKGDYNKKRIGITDNLKSSWIVTNTLRTIEFRIGEMSFDYTVLVNRIIHANDIARRMKGLSKQKINPPRFLNFNKQIFLDYLKKIPLQSNKIVLEKVVNPKKLINSRVIKL